jgi:hypothetical protein
MSLAVLQQLPAIAATEPEGSQTIMEWAFPAVRSVCAANSA